MTPKRILLPIESSLTVPKTKDAANKINDIVVMGWNIFFQYSRDKLFLLYSDMFNFRASLSSPIDRYLGDRIHIISLS